MKKQKGRHQEPVLIPIRCGLLADDKTVVDLRVLAVSNGYKLKTVQEIYKKHFNLYNDFDCAYDMTKIDIEEKFIKDHNITH